MQKSAFYSLFPPVDSIDLKNADLVNDGGFLLHKVVWHTNEQFSTILVSM